MTNLNNFWFQFVDLIFPNCCITCEKALVGNEKHICTICLFTLPRITTGSPIHEIIKNKFLAFPQVKTVNSLFLYTKTGLVRKLLRSIKYNNEQELALYLGNLISAEIPTLNQLPEDCIIVPIPLHPRKQKIRGYNQSEQIGLGISNKTSFKIISDFLKRTNFTTSQTQKTRTERSATLQNAFEINITYNENTNHPIALVDDVLTTGATIEACIIPLIKAGITDIHIITIAAAR